MEQDYVKIGKMLHVFIDDLEKYFKACQNNETFKSKCLDENKIAGDLNEIVESELDDVTLEKTKEYLDICNKAIRALIMSCDFNNDTSYIQLANMTVNVFSLCQTFLDINPNGNICMYNLKTLPDVTENLDFFKWID